MPTYISGPMTGQPENNVPAFNAKAAELRAAGVEVVNPVEVCAHLPPDACWRDFMRGDIVALMGCNSIHMLPGWWRSEGARLEWWLALKLGMKIEGAAE